MKVLVTGATGLVGNALVKKLAARGDRVRALVRDVERARKVVPGEVELVRGDVTDPASLAAAAQGIELFFHAAGMPEQWVRDERIFDRVNHEGTKNALQAAAGAKVKRVVLTSTLDVFGAPRGGTLDEQHPDPEPKHTAYERSKVAAERAADGFVKQGLDVVFVNPSGVYGPAPVHVTLNTFFIRLLEGKVPMVPPGGMSVVYIDGLVDAHLAAAERGKTSERYLVSDSHHSMLELAQKFCAVAGLPKVPPLAPAWVIKGIANVSAPFARALNVEPLVSQGQTTFLLWNARADSSKAQRELGFQPTPLERGLAVTAAFLKGVEGSRR
jgi:dihydroflavonol-4-reductase